MREVLSIGTDPVHPTIMSKDVLKCVGEVFQSNIYFWEIICEVMGKWCSGIININWGFRYMRSIQTSVEECQP